MTLPVSGTIALSQVNTELGKAAAAAVSLNEAAVRTLAGKPSGTISMSDLHGKSAVSRVTAYYTFSGHTANPQPNIAAVAGYIAGKTDFYITVNPGVYIYSDSAAPAMNILGGVAGDTITLINNGFIMGKGGNGQVFSYDQPSNTSVDYPATPGYTALQIAYPITIDNQNGYIGGGGGAGGYYSGGGGAGGGKGGSPGISNGYIGGDGGGLGGGGANGNGAAAGGAGGGGGRVMPGTGGAARVIGDVNGAIGLGGGAGGGGGIYTVYGSYPGGGGGGWGAAGGPCPWSNDNTVFGTAVSGAGGSSNGAGANSYFANGSSVITALNGQYPGTAGGKAINTQGKAVTLVGASGSRIFGIMS